MLRLSRLMLVPLVASTAVIGLVGSPAPAAAGAEAFPAQIDLPAGWAPEGITAGRGTTVYVGSLANGGIWEGDVRSGTGSVLVPGAAGQAALGVDYDFGRDRLWVAGGPTGAVRVYGIGSGELLATYEFEAGFLNDLVVTRRAVYVTDSFVRQMAVIPLGRGGALPAQDEVFTRALSGEIAYVDGAFNANGIVAAGGWLVVVQSSTGEVFRVDPTTGVAATLDVGGVTVPGGDGLELHGRTLYVVRGEGVVDVFRLNRLVRSAKLEGSLTSDDFDFDFDFPTTAAYTAGRLWVVNARFTTPPTPTTPYWITRLPARP